MKMSFNQIVFLLSNFLFLNGCGEKNTTNKLAERLEPNENSSTWITGLYRADFKTLNPHVNGTLPGSATVFLKDEKIYFYLRLFAGKPRAWHQQAIRLGSRCPVKSDDKNGDGFIDIDEADEIWGKIITPLDSDPGSQNSGKNFYPTGDLSGSYWYERIVSYNRFISDLSNEDTNLEDNIVKLPLNQSFSFENKVVSILGIDDKTPLPETVATQGKKPSFQNLPIACGVIKKVTTMPGTPDAGIPGPVGEVVADQDRPGAPVSPSGTIGNSRGSGSNENEESETTDENGNPERREGSETSEGTESNETDPTEPETPEVDPEVPTNSEENPSSDTSTEGT